MPVMLMLNIVELTFTAESVHFNSCTMKTGYSSLFLAAISVFYFPIRRKLYPRSALSRTNNLGVYHLRNSDRKT